MKQNPKLNSSDLKHYLNHIIENNQFIQEQGEMPIAVRVMGEPGIGKTSTIIQIGEEKNLPVVKMNLAQIEDLGDLIGYPSQEFQIAVEAEKSVKEDPKDPNSKVVKKKVKVAKWVDSKLLNLYIDKGAVPTGKTRLGYSLPSWISDKKEGGILLLDDFNRAEPKFQQAIMELVDRQSYFSFSLPKNWHIILTGNPDNGEYMVAANDDAQETRSASVEIKFDIEPWAEWAEGKVDGRCINFLVMNPDLVTKNTNPRIITIFFKSIMSIKDFKKNLGLIQMLGESTVGLEFSSMFSTFIAKDLDKLLSPKEIMDLKDKDVNNKIKEAVIDADGNYISDIASILALRFANYCLAYFKTNRLTQKHLDRIISIIVDGSFPQDLAYYMLKKLEKEGVKFERLFQEPEIIKMVSK